MNTLNTNDFGNLLTSDLIARLDELCQRERSCQIEIIRHLMEVASRQEHLALGYDSMWSFCRERLGMSEGMTSRRLQTARLAEKHPEVLELVANNTISLCVASVIARHVAAGQSENGEPLATVVSLVAGKSRREAESILAGCINVSAPRPVIRTLGLVSRAPTVLGSSLEQPGRQAIEKTRQSDRDVRLVASTGGGDEIIHRVSFNAGTAALADLERLRRLFPGRSIDEILALAVKTLVEKNDPLQREVRRSRRRDMREPCKAAISNRPAPGAEYHVPAAHPQNALAAKVRRHHVATPLRDFVLARDGGRCTYVGTDGHRCNSEHRAEVDHIRPFALGGSSTDPVNLRTLCSNHNRWRARVTFGDRVSTPRRD